MRFLNTVSLVILLNETEMWARQAAPCSRKSEEQLGASQRDWQLQTKGSWARTAMVSAFALSPGALIPTG